MLMLYGLGFGTDVVAAGSTPLPAPSTTLTARFASAALTQVAPQQPAGTGCPGGYVQTEFGCMAPTKPGATCPPGSIQTGNGCLPSIPAPVPQPVVPLPVSVAPIPRPHPLGPNAQAQCQELVTGCPRDPTHPDCVKGLPVCMAAFPSMFGPAVVVEAARSTPPISTGPVATTSPPLVTTVAPAAPAGSPVKIGLMIAGGIGVAALIGFAAFRR